MFDYGDPYIEWNEEIEAREVPEENNEIEETSMAMELEQIKSEVIKILISDFDFLGEEANEAVEESVRLQGDKWHENSDPKALAEYLASEDGDE